MLSEQQLSEIAIKTQGSFINVAREYVQHLFLNYFYAQENSGSILFKGGTALRILYKSPRFSEDLDFSTPMIRKQVIEDLLQETLVKLDLEGIGIDLEESTATTGGFLCILNAQIARHKFDISIEISSRKKKPTGQLIVVENPYIDTYTLMSLKREELISEKIEALLNRKKPRDFFDLYYMLRSNLMPEKSVLKKILPIVEKTKINFKKELGEFLPQSHQRIIKGFRDVLISEIKRYI
ncbi:nucleotidyl transferase AbiEii/AbiGii toxin family protein [Candidatus Saganbacteria bacterium]|nr:nucleotidyl transferase AbiEii/AbiGii toxin family protein [Candidatus Saganbacteria bacterium]